MKNKKEDKIKRENNHIIFGNVCESNNNNKFNRVTSISDNNKNRNSAKQNSNLNSHNPNVSCSRNNYFNRNNDHRVILSLFELTILIIGVIAFAWMVGGYNLEVLPSQSQIGFVAKTFDIIPSVSAQSTPSMCCINSQSGNSCQEFSSADCSNKCNGQCVASSCNQVAQCKLGCCIDSKQGLCSPNSQKSQCQSNGGIWKDDASCNVNECKLGCCTLGLNAQFITDQACKQQSTVLGLPEIFDANKDQNACIGSAGGAKIGACVLDQTDNGKNNCKFTTQQDCLGLNGNFHENYLCSNPTLNTVCEKQKTTQCFEGKDGVYWVDSCGNIENIYSSDKISSWNNGMVLAKSQSCNSNSNNAGSSTCGNCDYNLGSVCGVYRPGVDTKMNDGDYSCRSLNCKNAIGNAEEKKDRINGESWCVYDGQIGGQSFIPTPSKDVVGSRHFVYQCVNGNVQVEPCADYRKEICVQSKQTLSNGQQVDHGLCRVNMWEDCIALNSQQGCTGGCLGKCTQNPDCRIFAVNVDTNFHFNACVPKYPGGFDLGATSGLGNLGSSFSGALGNIGTQLSGIGQSVGNLGSNLLQGSNAGTSASQVCSLGTQTCTVTYQKTGIPPFCTWKAIQNEKCESIAFTQQMNNLCVSLGDCGAYVNIAGKVTSGGASVSKQGNHGHAPPSPGLLAFQYIIYASPVRGQFASSPIYNTVQGIDQLSSLGITNPLLQKPANGAGGINAGGGGVSGTIIGGVAGGVAGGLSGIAIYSGSVMGGAGFFTGAGAGLNYCITSGALCLSNPWVLGAIVVGALIGAISGCGKIEYTQIKFECKPWTRPAGGGTLADALNMQNNNFFAAIGGNKGCDFCTSDPLKPCTQYRCESLGNRCKLINQDTGQEKCITDTTASSIPIITPNEDVLNKSKFEYTDVSTNGFKVRDKSGDCLQAFTPLIFGVKTDVYSVCQIGSDPNLSDAQYFLEGNIFAKNHTTTTYLPSADSIIATETNVGETVNASDYQNILNKVGDINLYVKCQNPDGQSNAQDFRINFCVAPGPDLTPPIIVATAPAPNSYVAYNAVQQEAAFFVNEPAECRWSLDNVNYTTMNNSMGCNTDVNSGTLLGYLCNTTLPIRGNTDNHFYVSCRDQPWLGNNNSRNVGNNYDYILKKSTSQLNIDSISPSGNITKGSEPASVEISAITSGGVDGTAQCNYSLNNQEQIPFYVTGTNTHSQILNQMTRGDYNLTVNCGDSAGNTAVNSTEFNLQLDTTAPIITRVNYDSGKLAIQTNENAICGYSFNSSTCDFNIDNSTLMQTDLSLIHTADWQLNNIYHIKCRDVFGNQPVGCSINAQPTSIADIKVNS